MIPFQPFIEPVRYRDTAPDGGLRVNLVTLCAQAGIRLRATVPARPVQITFGSQQIRTPHVDVVGVPVADLASPEAALRALEALAMSFHDHGARACVCSRGFFTSPSRAPSLKERFWAQHEKAGLHERHVFVLNQILDERPRSLTSSTWARMAPCSHDTASRDLKQLVKVGLLTLGRSGGRSTQYELVEPR